MNRIFQDVQDSIGESSQHGLDHSTLTAIVREALDVVQPGERVLAIIPDKTRDDNTHLLFPVATEFLSKRGVASFDALVAQGTHPPMSESQKLRDVQARQSRVCRSPDV